MNMDLHEEEKEQKSELKKEDYITHEHELIGNWAG